jgi:uncharacterized membrane protein YoaK (UPF0700 family)
VIANKLYGSEEGPEETCVLVSSKPPSPEAHARSEGRRALSRGLICGYVDSYTLLTFGVYASFMSGNTISTGMQGGEGKLVAAAHNLLPIPFFVFGAFLGAVFQPEQTARQMRRVSLAVAGLLAVGVVAIHLPAPTYACLILLSIAMGMMNTTVSKVGGQSVNLGFVTGHLKNLGGHLANIVNGTPVSHPQGPWDNHWRGAGSLASIWTSFLAGALLGAAAASRFLVWTLLLPALFLATLAWSESTTISDCSFPTSPEKQK